MTSNRFLVGGAPTYAGHRIGLEYVSPGEVVQVGRYCVDDDTGIKYAFSTREKNGASLSIDLSSLIWIEEAPAVPQFTINVLKARTADLNAAREKLDRIEQLVSDAQCNAFSHIAISSLIEALR